MVHEKRKNGAERAREVGDPRPVSVPARFKAKVSQVDEIKRLIRNELSTEAARHGIETLQESNDFDCGPEDDFFPLPTSGHEISHLPEDAQFQYVEPAPLDVQDREEYDGDAPNTGVTTKVEAEDVATEHRRNEDGEQGSGERGEVGAASGGEGRSAGKRGAGVSEVRRGGRGSAEAGRRGDRGAGKR